jgi:Fur family ferric uptake transcriptional regulator
VNVDAQDLRDVGLKVTGPRIRILGMLAANATRHMTAEDVYRELLANGDEIGLATIYRVLTQFESAGLVKRHHFEGTQSVFELDEGEHHDHLVCVSCGRVVEFCDDIIEQRQRAVAEEAGFDLQEHSMILYGLCRNDKCANKKGAGKPQRTPSR